MMITPASINEKINALKDATRRPLFAELVKFQEPAAKKDLNVDQHDEKTTTRATHGSWIQTVQEVSDLLPYMTDDQRGQVWRLVSILVLGFWLPHSTGHEASMSSSSSSSTITAVTDLSLEERLARALHYQHVVTQGTLLVDTTLLLGWHDFVHQALRHFLSSCTSPLPVESEPAADLLHCWALAITPRVNRLELDLPADHRGTHQQQHATVERLYRLSTCPTAAYFSLQDGQRQELVQLLYQYWPSPLHYHDGEHDMDTAATNAPTPCLAWTCGMAHLRASLSAWARRHYSPTVAHVMGLQARLETSWTRAWNTALHQLVAEDRVDYHSTTRTANMKDDNHENNDDDNNMDEIANATTSCSCGNGNQWVRQSLPFYHEPNQPRPLPPPRCPHIQRGFVLTSLLLESLSSSSSSSSSSGSSTDQHAQHMGTAMAALGDALEWQQDAWTVDEEKTVAPITCLTTVLLRATSLLWHLVDARWTRGAHTEVYANVLHCSIQLLRHTDDSIRWGATQVLQHAWNTLGLSPTPFCSVMVTTLQQIKVPAQRLEWKNMIGILARSSPAFAQKVAPTLDVVTDHALVAAVASNQPGSFPVLDLEKALEQASSSEEQALSLVAALLASRQSYFFEEKGKQKPIWDRVSNHLEKVDPWNKYRMGLFALTNGEYHTAANLFQQLTMVTKDMNHYLWIEILATVAQAEDILCKQAAVGIPSAGTLLHNALAYLDGLQTQPSDQDYSFQIRFLLLRLDILDLTTVLRQIMREMRLTGQLPAKGTRTFSHVPSIFRSFLRLAKKFTDLDQRFGLLWQSRRTSSCLASFRDLALFLAETTRSAFGSIMPAGLMKMALPNLSTKLVFPINKLLRELDNLVVHPFIKAGNAVDCKTISTALLQVLDGVLMVPIPIPRDFCAPLPVLEVQWDVRPDAVQVAEMRQSSFGVVESFHSVSPTITVEGMLLNATKVRRSLRYVVMSYQIRHLGPLEDDGELRDAVLLSATPSQVKIPLSRQGRFHLSFDLPPLLEEGWYRLETGMKAQAVDGRTYDMAVGQSSTTRIKLRISRSR